MDATQYQQDMPRKDERGTQNDPHRVAVLCGEFAFSPSKASRVCRAFSSDARANGWDADDADVFVAWLAAVQFPHQAEQLRHRLARVRCQLHADPTGERATDNALAADIDPANVLLRGRDKRGKYRDRRVAAA